MGFNEHWIRLMMLCVKTMTYFILVNREPKRRIPLTRGIRQGDPLSPFLFILCTEGLNGLINQAAQQGHIKGYSLCRNSSRLTRLLFADESVLFCKATIEECQRVLDILEVYGRCSGQQINQSKTTIFFSKSTSDDTRNQIKLALGAPEIIYIWEPQESSFSSHAWHSILKGRDVLLKGERWRGGCEEAISISNDAWLPSLEHPRVLSDMELGFEDGRVSDLINPFTRTWNLNLVHGLLSLDEAALVLSIPLSRTPMKDNIIWPFTPSGKYTDLQQATQALAIFQLSQQPLIQPTVISRPQPHAQWSPPPSNCLKLNFDGAVFPELGKAGLGVVVHDCQGNVIASLSEQVPLQFSPDIVESMAAARAMTFAKGLGLAEFILEGDSEASLSSFGHLLESAKSTLVTSKCITFSRVCRTGNKVVYNLARHTRHVRGLSLWVEDVSPHLFDVLFADPS
ncbi:uncharacterized protein LOC142629163 [Castanea sativa]|uniref:uncharacterized protein LOC142629163 n=1 Tax=Castanea sativa TaxID=21020 RepID=UPI003F653120